MPNGPAALLSSIAHGDHAGWEALYHRLAPDLERVAKTLCGDDGLAKDALQEAALAVVAAAGRFRPRSDDPDSDAKRFCLAIAAHAAMAMARRQRRHVALSETPAPAPGADARMIASETSAHLRAALAELPEEFAQAVSLHHLGGLSCQEVAAVQGVGSATVRTRIWRGLRQLRDRLERRGLVLGLAALATLLHQQAAAADIPPPQSSITSPFGTELIMASTSIIVTAIAVGAWVWLPAAENIRAPAGPGPGRQSISLTPPAQGVAPASIRSGFQIAIGPATNAALSADGRYIAVGTPTGLRLVATATGAVVWSHADAAGARDPRFSDDGARLGWLTPAGDFWMVDLPARAAPGAAHRAATGSQRQWWWSAANRIQWLQPPRTDGVAAIVTAALDSDQAPTQVPLPSGLNAAGAQAVDGGSYLVRNGHDTLNQQVIKQRINGGETTIMTCDTQARIDVLSAADGSTRLTVRGAIVPAMQLMQRGGGVGLAALVADGGGGLMATWLAGEPTITIVDLRTAAPHSSLLVPAGRSVIQLALARTGGAMAYVDLIGQTGPTRVTVVDLGSKRNLATIGSDGLVHNLALTELPSRNAYGLMTLTTGGAVGWHIVPR